MTTNATITAISAKEITTMMTIAVGETEAVGTLVVTSEAVGTIVVTSVAGVVAVPARTTIGSQRHFVTRVRECYRGFGL